LGARLEAGVLRNAGGQSKAYLQLGEANALRPLHPSPSTGRQGRRAPKVHPNGWGCTPPRCPSGSRRRWGAKVGWASTIPHESRCNFSQPFRLSEVFLIEPRDGNTIGLHETARASIAPVPW